MYPDDSAFPLQLRQDNSYAKGLTKREYIAAQALSGLLSAFTEAVPLPDAIEAAQQAVEYADALIEELSKTKN